MIKLVKSKIPSVLETNEASWTKSVKDKKSAGIEPSPTELSRYRHAEIKEALLLETHGKCAYCESKFEHITYGDVEHVSPKSLDPDNMFKWSNLTLACDICNTNKGNKFPRGEGLVDPYIYEPSEHFRVVGPLIFGLPNDDNARLTEETLKLNRTALVERRQQKIHYLRSQVDVIAKAADRLKPVLLENLMLELAVDQEYSAIANEYLKPYIGATSIQPAND